MLKDHLQSNTIPVVFTDGFCPHCGKPAPVVEYNQIVKSHRGKIIIDDTQAFGIFGKPEKGFVYGSGGGGILRWLNLTDRNIITIVSLAKAFGVPLAVISGNKDFISLFEDESVTREASSPVSQAHVKAAFDAIACNKYSGDKRRRKLYGNVLFLRTLLMQSKIHLNGAFFPVQSLAGTLSFSAVKIYASLKKRRNTWCSF